MGKPKYDGVIEAVHYQPDGKIAWVRAYLRNGPIWSDRVLVDRTKLVDLLKAGKNVQLGSRIEQMGGEFNISKPVKLDNDRILAGQSTTSTGDHLEGAPVI